MRLAKIRRLINPNPYIDVPGLLALRDGEFSGVWFDFVITRPIDGKQFLEEQILKPLGLYWIVRADGHLSLKTMKPPVEQTPVFSFSAKNIMGIPQTQRQNIINLVTLSVGRAARRHHHGGAQLRLSGELQQQTSLQTYRQVFEQQIQSTGLRVARGGMMLSRLLADRIFRRHAFGPPTYKFTAQLATLPVELGDYVWLSHPKVLDLNAGQAGAEQCGLRSARPAAQLQPGHGRFHPARYAVHQHLAALPDCGGGWQYSTLEPSSPSSGPIHVHLLRRAGGENSDGTAGNTIF